MKLSSSFKDQSGLVSIMVASVLMVIMALITLGFTRLVSNEQRQSIDDQLSKQAFYAAESGINLVSENVDFEDMENQSKDDCNVNDPLYDVNNGVVVDGNVEAEDVEITCILIDPTPTDIRFDNDSIVSDKSRVIPISTNATASNITFSWGDSNPAHSDPGPCSTNFLTNDSTLPLNPAEQWNRKAILKLDLIRIPTTGTFSRDDLINTNQFSAIMLPCNGGAGTVVFDDAVQPSGKGRVVHAACTTAPEYECSVTISGVNSSNMYARFNSIYGAVNVRVTATGASAEPLYFSDVQAIVDSTGRSKDVFRRLQARVPLYDSFQYPNAALQTLEDVCKLYTVLQSSVDDGCN